VQGHLTEELTADRLARQACVSKRTLARRFVETTGTSPAAWVVGLRIARVKELLETTTLSIEEVADKCGFGSSFALRHHFRKRLQTNPSAYRSRFSTKPEAKERAVSNGRSWMTSSR
jgi:AraC family transcriptional activator FtrA